MNMTVARLIDYLKDIDDKEKPVRFGTWNKSKLAHTTLSDFEGMYISNDEVIITSGIIEKEQSKMSIEKEIRPQFYVDQSGPRRIYIGKRKSSKSTRLLEISSEAKIPILVAHEKQIEYLIELAKHLELEIPKPFSVNQLLNQKDGTFRHKEILVDEALAVIEVLLGTQVEGMTISTYGENDVSRARP